MLGRLTGLIELDVDDRYSMTSVCEAHSIKINMQSGQITTPKRNLQSQTKMHDIWGNIEGQNTANSEKVHEAH